MNYIWHVKWTLREGTSKDLRASGLFLLYSTCKNGNTYPINSNCKLALQNRKYKNIGNTQVLSFSTKYIVCEIVIELRSRWCLIQMFFTSMFEISCVYIFKKKL